jgi:hypothetical protein
MGSEDGRSRAFVLQRGGGCVHGRGEIDPDKVYFGSNTISDYWKANVRPEPSGWDHALDGQRILSQRVIAILASMV